MAAPTVEPPDPAEVERLATLFELVRDWGWAVAVPAVATAVLWASRLYSKASAILTKHDRDLEEHAEKQRRHEIEIESLKLGRAAADVRIAALPTRDEFYSQFDRLYELLNLAIGRKDARGD